MKKMNTLDKVLLIVEVQIVAFTIATIIIYTIKEWQFDTLITCFLGLFGGIEPAITGGIQIAKYFRNKEKEEPIEYRDYAIGFQVESEEEDEQLVD